MATPFSFDEPSPYTGPSMSVAGDVVHVHPANICRYCRQPKVLDWNGRMPEHSTFSGEGLKVRCHGSGKATEATDGHA